MLPGDGVRWEVAIDELGAVTGVVREEVLHVGGGSRIDLVNRLLAERTGLPVRIGSPEATALGNALLQGIALGTFADVDAARTWAGAGSLQLGGTA